MEQDGDGRGDKMVSCISLLLFFFQPPPSFFLVNRRE
jgi:hypothetical protein